MNCLFVIAFIISCITGTLSANDPQQPTAAGIRARQAKKAKKKSEKANQPSIEELLEQTSLEEAQEAMKKRFQQFEEYSKNKANTLIASFLTHIDNQEEKHKKEYKKEKSAARQAENMTALTNFLPFLVSLSFIGPKKLSVIATIASVFVLYKKVQSDVEHKKLTAYENLEGSHEMLKRKILVLVLDTVTSLKGSPEKREEILQDNPFIQLLQKLNNGHIQAAQDLVERQGWYAEESPFKGQTQQEINEFIQKKSASLINYLVTRHFNSVDFLQRGYKPASKKLQGKGKKAQKK